MNDNIAYSVDHPIDFNVIFNNKNQLEKQDLLKFRELTECIYKYLKNVIDINNSVNIGIYGEWGCGKTSLMNILRAKLEGDKSFFGRTIWYNAWRYDNEVNPLVPLFKTIENHFEDKDKKRANFFSKLANLLLLSTSMKLGLPFSTGIEFSPEKGFKIYRDAVEILKEQKVLNYFDLPEQLRKMLLEESDGNRINPLIIFIDDLDRCSPENALKIIDSIKTIFDTKGYHFIIGIDPKPIIEWLKRKYQGVHNYNVDLYLQKIIQIEIPVPFSKRKIDSIILEKINKFNLLEYKKEIIEWLHIIPKLTVRHINYYFNYLKTIETQSELKIPQIIESNIVIIIKTVWPTFFNYLKERPENIIKNLEFILNKKNIEKLGRYDINYFRNLIATIEEYPDLTQFLKDSMKLLKSKEVNIDEHILSKL